MQAQSARVGGGSKRTSSSRISVIPSPCRCLIWAGPHSTWSPKPALPASSAGMEGRGEHKKKSPANLGELKSSSTNDGRLACLVPGGKDLVLQVLDRMHATLLAAQCGEPSYHPPSRGRRRWWQLSWKGSRRQSDRVGGEIPMAHAHAKIPLGMSWGVTGLSPVCLGSTCGVGKPWTPVASVLSRSVAGRSGLPHRQYGVA
jgi:hypothetical protein